jgi:hypothetical protein
MLPLVRKVQRKKIYPVFIEKNYTQGKSLEIKQAVTGGHGLNKYGRPNRYHCFIHFFKPLKVLNFKYVISERKYISIFLDISASKTVENSCITRLFQPVFLSVQVKIISSYSDHPPQTQRTHSDIYCKTSAK